MHPPVILRVKYNNGDWLCIFCKLQIDNFYHFEGFFFLFQRPYTNQSYRHFILVASQISLISLSFSAYLNMPILCQQVLIFLRNYL